MPTSAVIKNSEFELVSEFAQPDAKKRLSLGEAAGGARAYNIYRNPLGQLILDPVKTIPPPRCGFTRMRRPWPA